jgi:hypothetical protein
MKNNRKFAWSALTSLMATGMVLAAAQAGAESIPQVVQVVKVEGNAQYSTDGHTWQTLHQGDILKPGAVIRTAEKSIVDVVLGEEGTAGGNFKGPNLLNMPNAGGGGGAGAGGGGGGGAGGASDTEKANIVRIFQSTVLGVDKLTVERTGVDEVSDTQLDLRAGQIMANVKKLSAQSKYEIKVPNGVAGIRGSWVLGSPSVWVCGQGELKYAGLNSFGAVQVWNLTSGEKLDTTSGKTETLSPEALQQYAALHDNALESAFGEAGVSIKSFDISCGTTCSVDGR